jgi:negative regulator of flagellin synthesis FlgM
MSDITKINSNQAHLSTNQSSSDKSQNETKHDEQSADSTAAGDRVTLTNTASHLKNIEQQLNNTSAVDSARVAAVQSAISNNEYTVDTNRIANKMLAFEDFMINNDK